MNTETKEEGAFAEEAETEAAEAEPAEAEAAEAALVVEEAPDPEARRRELEAEMAAAQSVFPRAEDFGVHDLIDPRQTRPRLCQWVDEVQTQLRALRGPRSYGPRP